MDRQGEFANTLEYKIHRGYYSAFTKRRLVELVEEPCMSYLLEQLKAFSNDYAKGVSAIAALGALILGLITLWFLKREFAHKYRPYVQAVIMHLPVPNSKAFGVTIVPRNIGSYPCEIRLTNICLRIGDENYGTPDLSEWLLVSPQAHTQNLMVSVPAGHVNELGIQHIRDARYKTNRIEVAFVLHTRSIEKKYEEKKMISYEINVQGDAPVILFRPDWHKTV